MNVNDGKFIDIIKRCNFLIYLSGSEGGCPGGVLNLMKVGIIPIVSKWAAMDSFEKIGYILHSLDERSIDDSIKWANSLPKKTVVEMKEKAIEYVSSTHTIQKYIQEFETFFSEIK